MNKTKHLLFILILIFYNCSNESNSNDGEIFTGDVLLRSQEEINDFGSNQYQRIAGRLSIRPDFSFDDIIDLSPINSIIKVDNIVTISSCSLLENIELNMLEVGSLLITDMKKIDTVYFPLLKSTTSDYLIIENNDLLTIVDFPMLNSTGTELVIKDNAKLENLNFYALKSLGSNFGPSVLRIEGNSSLLSLEGLNTINSLVEYLMIINNESLASLSGINNIRFDRIAIINNYNLTNLCAIKNSFTDIIAYDISGNSFNPSVNDIINGNCSQ